MKQQQFTPADGALAEQYSRNDGMQISARDLTWSYAAFLTAYSARKGVVPASWGASFVSAQGALDTTRADNALKSELSPVCSASSAQGPCSAATNTVWPSSTSKPPCTTPAFTTLMFNVRKPTSYGQNIFFSGNTPQLGGWNTSQAIPLSAGKYTEKQPLWYTFKRFPVGAAFEYKYVLKNEDGNTIVWELGPNRRYVVPASCAVSIAVDDDWR